MFRWFRWWFLVYVLVVVVYVVVLVVVLMIVVVCGGVFISFGMKAVAETSLICISTLNRIYVNCTVSCQIHEYNNKFINGHNRCVQCKCRNMNSIWSRP